MDVEQINNFMSTASKEEVQYSDAQWLYINDSNFGGYNNYLQFITTTLKMQVPLPLPLPAPPPAVCRQQPQCHHARGQNRCDQTYPTDRVHPCAVTE